MIYLYLGTPGSGKSFHATQRIYDIMRSGVKTNIICNYPVNTDLIFLTNLGYLKRRITLLFPKLVFKKYNIKPVKGNFTYADNNTLSVDYLMKFAEEHHRYKSICIGGIEQRFMPENQTLVIIDEAAVMFNCRDWNDKKRQDWCKFFAQHRHYGFNFILITQAETMLDKQIRVLIEMFVHHRNLRYYNLFAKIISLICGGSLFLALSRWQGVKEVMSREAFRYSPRVASIYNSYMIFDSKQTTATGGKRSPQGEGLPQSANDCTDVKELEVFTDDVPLSESA